MIGALNDIVNTLSTGIPGIVVAGLSIVIMILALIRGDAGMMIVAGLMIIPLTYISGSWYGWGLLVRLLPLLVFVAAYFISVAEIVIAWIVPIPAFGYVAYYVFTLIFDSYRNIQL